jgi:hydrogenase maturation protease HycI
VPDSAFRRALKQALSTDSEVDGPVVVLGVGSELRSDDAAGLKVVERLLELPLPQVHALSGGTAPENRTSEIRRLAPSQLIIVDSADMGMSPGSIGLIDPADIDRLSPGTHSLPLSVLADYISRETGCAVTLIGIQPRTLEFGGCISKEVESAVGETVDALAECLGPQKEPPLTRRDGAPAP